MQRIPGTLHIAFPGYLTQGHAIKVHELERNNNHWLLNDGEILYLPPNNFINQHDRSAKAVQMKQGT